MSDAVGGAQPLQCQLTEIFNQQGGGPLQPYLTLWLPGNRTGNSYDAAQSFYAQFWVLSGSQPLGKPLVFSATDTSTVPAGLAPLMTSKNIVVAGFANFGTQAPSGALFNFLMANGSGAMLTTLEAMNASMACGVYGPVFYGLVAIPGQGPNSGVEFMDYPAQLSYAGANNQWAGQFPFTLQPDATGGYIPVRSF
jgi:hypothetical protein